MQNDRVKQMRKRKTGVVVSDKMDKTAVVEVERLFRHPLYDKAIKKTSRFKAHDEENKCKTGDKVVIVETRPVSKDKRWRIERVMA